MENFKFKEEIESLKSSGLLRELPQPENEKLFNFSSNDYLGLSHHSALVDAAASAAKQWGVGATASRLLAGTKTPHVELEKDLAAFLKKEAALVFGSGYHVNTGVIPALAQSGDIVFFDRLCHASILDGLLLSRAKFFSFEHNDTLDLERKLKEKRGSYRRAFIITEGLFSMDGDFPELRRISRLAKAYDALIYLDEAHSFGVWGPEGRGVAAHLNLLDEVFIYVGTLSKTLGSQGGFVAANQEIINLLVSRCRSFIYSTGLSPVLAHSARMALEMLPLLEERRERVRGTSERIRRTLKELNFSILTSESQIIPIWTGELETTQRFSRYLSKHGFYVPSIRPPTVPVGQGRVRLSVTYDVLGAPVDKLLQTIAAYPEIPIPGESSLVTTG